MPLLLHAAPAACPAVLAAACPAVLAAALLACSKQQQHWELAPNCAALYLNFRPTPEEPTSGRGERRKTFREASSVQSHDSATFPCVGDSGFMPRASHCLEGHWVRMRSGEAVMAHPLRRMSVGCHRPRTQRGTSCCAVTGTSSAALRGGECLAPSHFFHETSRCGHVFFAGACVAAAAAPTFRLPSAVDSSFLGMLRRDPLNDISGITVYIAGVVTILVIP
jgi:hypothetical protein